MNAFSRRLARAGGMVALAAVAIGNARAANEQVFGDAFDLQGNQMLYQETHCVDEKAASRQVVYRNPDGRVIAYKLLDYRSGATTPSFVQHNLYSSEKVSVELDAGRLSMSQQAIGEREPARPEEVSVDPKLPLVIDAGFDSFVRDHWDALLAGESKRFQFPVAASSRLLEMRIGPIGCSDGEGENQCFRLEPGSWLLRMLAAPIELGYDRETRRLARYRGLSNIGDANGGGLEVDIRYRYPDASAGTCGVEPGLASAQAGAPAGRRP